MRNRLIFFAFVFAAFHLNSQEEAPQMTEAEQKALLVDNIRGQNAGNNAFSLELYYRLKSQEGNIFCSPYSITSALVLPFAGSAGATQAQLHTILHYLNDEEGLFSSFEWLNQHFSTPWYSGPNETKVYIGNSLWIERDLRILPKFMNTAQKYFRNSLQRADFSRNPQSSRLNINNWVREKTQGHINEMLAPGTINNSTQMVVISSIFMKAVWEKAFDPILTAATSFFSNNINTVSVPMMTTTGNFPIYQGDTFTILELPYRGGGGERTQFSFLVFLPKDTFGLPSVENQVLNGTLENWLKLLRIDRVIVFLPKFKFASNFQLKSVFQQMGMYEPFNENADFSGIDGSRNLVLSEVIHKAYLSVDEKGTEAVAATAVTIETKAYNPESPLIFKADHPFMFMIIDKSINSILFIGRLVSP